MNHWSQLTLTRRAAPVVTPELTDPCGVGSVRRGPGAGASPGPPRWLDQKHAHRRNQESGGVARSGPAS